MVRIVAWGTAVLLALGAQQPPQPQQPPTFRTGAELVRVDVTVLDRGGKPVIDLAADDFAVFEDGVAQPIQTFQLIEFDGTHGPDDDLTLTIGPRDNRDSELARDDVRLIVVFWDEYHIRPDYQAVKLKEELATFLRTMLNPTDFVAIMDPWTPMSHLYFSRDRYRLATEVRALKGRLGDLVPRNAAEENHFRPGMNVPFVREQVALTALKSALAHLGTLREGRKTLLYVSQEFGLGRDTNMWATDVIRAANDANVAVYSINPIGLQVNRSNFRSGLLASIAHGTGGESFVSNSPSLALERAVSQGRASYLLGYAPTPMRYDGKFHQIEVKVKRGGVQVRARNGYFAPSVAEMTAASKSAEEAVLPTPIETAFKELVRSARPDEEDQPGEVRTILVPDEPSAELSVRAPVVWRIRQPIELKAALAGDLPPHHGREFARSDRLLVTVPVAGDGAASANVTIGLIDRRGKRLTELPFTRTGDGVRIDLPLQSIARGEYLIVIAAEAGEHRAAAYLPVRVTDM
jgi:VWFA-related protein